MPTTQEYFDRALTGIRKQGYAIARDEIATKYGLTYTKPETQASL